MTLNLEPRRASRSAAMVGLGLRLNAGFEPRRAPPRARRVLAPGSRRDDAPREELAAVDPSAGRDGQASLTIRAFWQSG